MAGCFSPFRRFKVAPGLGFLKEGYRASDAGILRMAFVWVNQNGVLAMINCQSKGTSRGNKCTWFWDFIEILRAGSGLATMAPGNLNSGHAIIFINFST